MDGRATSLRIWEQPCIGRHERWHATECTHCCLRGATVASTADEKGLEPNYSGWQRIWVEVGEEIPARFAKAFVDAFNDENRLFAEALAADVVKYGVVIKGEIKS